MKEGIDYIIEERARQLLVEKHTVEKDKRYTANELALAAACYALPEHISSLSEVSTLHTGVFLTVKRIVFWPWSWKWWKPSPENRIRELAKAGALIAAEIDRLQNTK